MSRQVSRSLARGMYCPVPCFFNDIEDIDYSAFAKHVQHIARAGCLPVVSGTLGEATLLSTEERIEVIKTARNALDDIGLTETAIVAGAGAPSTRETISLCTDAAAAGADGVLIVMSGYYGGILRSSDSIEQHFIDVASASPIPVMIYDSIYATGGLDFSQEMLEKSAKRASNLCGVKLTCTGLGKLTRLASTIHADDFQKRYPRRDPNAPYLVLTGLIDNVLAAAAVGADGCIGGPPNFAPYASQRLWELSQGPLVGENLKEAVRLQAALARADAVAFDAGIPSLKWLLGDLYGYGKAPRRPLPCLSDEAGKKFRSAMQEILVIEKELEAGEPSMNNTNFVYANRNLE